METLKTETIESLIRDARGLMELLPWGSLQFDYFAGSAARGVLLLAQQIRDDWREIARLSQAYEDVQNRLRHTAHELGFSQRDLEKLQDAIRKHRDQRGDDRCWRDDEELYKVLPEGHTPPERDTSVELKNCQEFINSRQHPGTKYVSPEREIETLRKERDEARERHQEALQIAARLRDDLDRMITDLHNHGHGATCPHCDYVATFPTLATAQAADRQHQLQCQFSPVAKLRTIIEDIKKFCLGSPEMGTPVQRLQKIFDLCSQGIPANDQAQAEAPAESASQPEKTTLGPRDFTMWLHESGGGWFPAPAMRTIERRFVAGKQASYYFIVEPRQFPRELLIDRMKLCGPGGMVAEAETRVVVPAGEEHAFSMSLDFHGFSPSLETAVSLHTPAK